MNTNKGFAPIIAIIIAVIIIAGGAGVYTYLKNKNKPPIVTQPNISTLITPTSTTQTSTNVVVSSTPSTTSTEKTVFDCNSSDSCFSDYVKTCTPAKATISNQGLTYVETIKGYEGDNCILTLVYTESPVAGFTGKEMTCKIPKLNLVNFKDYLQGDRMKQSCKGPLFDFLIQMGAE
ncbi:MAG: hypothetical protein Q8N90_02725 [bacterium]|nr:hypothetical protein [bacterium]